MEAIWCVPLGGLKEDCLLLPAPNNYRNLVSREGQTASGFGDSKQHRDTALKKKGGGGLGKCLYTQYWDPALCPPPSSHSQLPVRPETFQAKYLKILLWGIWPHQEIERLKIMTYGWAWGFPTKHHWSTSLPFHSELLICFFKKSFM